MDRRPKHPCRLPLRRKRCRAHAEVCEGPGQCAARSDRWAHNSGTPPRLRVRPRPFQCSPRRRYRSSHQRPRRAGGQWPRGDVGHLHVNAARFQTRSSPLLPAIAFQRSTPIGTWLRPAGCLHTGPITPTYFEGCRPTLTTCLRAPSRPNCQSSCRPSSSSSST
jgi:hypothetical protein